MRKIVHPKCDSCTANAEFESTSGVQFCYQCLYATAFFFAKYNLLESNVLCELLFDGVWRTTDSTYEVWHRSLDHHASSQVWLNRIVK